MSRLFATKFGDVNIKTGIVSLRATVIIKAEDLEKAKAIAVEYAKKGEFEPPFEYVLTDLNFPELSTESVSKQLLACMYERDLTSTSPQKQEIKEEIKEKIFISKVGDIDKKQSHMTLRYVVIATAPNKESAMKIVKEKAQNEEERTRKDRSILSYEEREKQLKANFKEMTEEIEIIWNVWQVPDEPTNESPPEPEQGWWGWLMEQLPLGN